MKFFHCHSSNRQREEARVGDSSSIQQIGLTLSPTAAVRPYFPVVSQSQMKPNNRCASSSADREPNDPCQPPHQTMPISITRRRSESEKKWLKTTIDHITLPRE